MVCAYGNPKKRPPDKPLCADGENKRGLPLGRSPHRQLQKDKETEKDEKN